jgi:hypothetical protein
LKRERRAVLRAARREPQVGSVDALKVRCEGMREADAASQSDGAFDTIGVTRHRHRRSRVVKNTYP